MDVLQTVANLPGKTWARTNTDSGPKQQTSHWKTENDWLADIARYQGKKTEDNFGNWRTLFEGNTKK